MTEQETTPVIATATQEQNYALTTLQQVSDRLRRRLHGIAKSATESEIDAACGPVWVRITHAETA